LIAVASLSRRRIVFSAAALDGIPASILLRPTACAIPMMRPETFSDWSHAIRAPSVISGGRTGGFLATVGPAELCPSSPHFFHSVRAGLPPTEVLSPSQKRVQLPELACNRCPPQLLFLFGVDSAPPPLKGSSLRLSHLLFHMSGPHNTTLDDGTLIPLARKLLLGRCAMLTRPRTA
jgi:hypothetical protein